MCKGVCAGLDAISCYVLRHGCQKVGCRCRKRTRAERVGSVGFLIHIPFIQTTLCNSEMYYPGRQHKPQLPIPIPISRVWGRVGQLCSGQDKISRTRSFLHRHINSILQSAPAGSIRQLLLQNSKYNATAAQTYAPVCINDAHFSGCARFCSLSLRTARPYARATPPPTSPAPSSWLPKNRL